jgi:hypothetical protein
MFGRLVVLLDHLAPPASVAAFVYQWQEQAASPVQVVAVPGREQPFATVSKWLGCHPELIVRRDGQLTTLWQYLRPDDLLVLGPTVPPVERNWVLERLREPGSPAVLVCPDHYRPLERVLALNPDRGPSASFLRQAVAITGSLRATPIVLTVARSEPEARSRQCQARTALAEQSVEVDFDFVVGSQPGPAVAHVARWRHAQLVIVEPPYLSAWQRWLHGNPLVRFHDGLDELPMLALPEPLNRERAEAPASAPSRSRRNEQTLVKS